MSAFICDLCGSDFKFKYEIILHLKDHKNGSVKVSKASESNSKDGSKERFKCAVCSKCFTRKENYKNHIHLHTGKSPHKCFVCGKSYTRNKLLEAHIKNHSPGNTAQESIKPKFSCDLCTKTFTRKAYLKAHISIHTKESAHKCSHCHKMFTRKYHLENHIRSHTGETPFKCDKCGERFMTKKLWQAHVNAGQCPKPTSFVCYICSKKFTKQSSVTNHIKRVHSADGNFKCDQCGKCFVVEPNLIYHLRSHKF